MQSRSTFLLNSIQSKVQTMLCDKSNAADSTNVFGATNVQNGYVDQPPTKTVTVKDSFTTQDYMSLLKLAQEKFNEMRNTRKERDASSLRCSSTRYSRPYSTSQDHAKVSQLFSSLLYLSLMMNKADDMKQALQRCNCNLYRDWEGLFSSLHSPLFHLKERRLQNQRTKRIFRRKLRYKLLNEEAKVSSGKMQETLNEMGEAISKMTDLNTLTSSQLQSKCDIERKLVASEEKIEYLNTLAEEKNELLHAAQNARDRLQSSLSKSETEKSYLTQKIENDFSRLVDLSEENKYLKEILEEKNGQLMILKNQMSDLEKEKIILEAALQADKFKYESSISKLTCDLDISRSTAAQTKSELEIMTTNHGMAVKSLDEEVNTLTTKVTSTETELKLCQLELSMVKKQLESKILEVETAHEAAKLQTNHQNKWRESLALRDKEISKLYTAVKGTESILSNSDSAREAVENGFMAKIEIQFQHILNTIGSFDELKRQLDESKAREFKLMTEKQVLEAELDNRSSVHLDFENTMTELNNIRSLLHDLKLEQNDKFQNG